MGFVGTDIKCDQCGYIAFYQEKNNETKEGFGICTTCGYSVKVAIQEDKAATKATVDLLKTYYNQGDYDSALYLVGFDEGIINSHSEHEKKKQVKRLITHPLRVPMISYDKDKGHSYNYVRIEKKGFGTYTFKEYTGDVMIGRFSNNQHAKWKTDEIIQNYDLYDEDNLVQITWYDIEEDKLHRII